MWLFGEDDTSKLQTPLQIRYMKTLKFNLNGIAAWDDRRIEGINSKLTLAKKIYIFIIEYFCLVTGVLYLINNFGKLSFFELGHTYITMFMNMLACSRLLLIFMEKYHKMIIQFIEKIHVFNYKDNSDYSMKVHLLVHKMSHFFTLYLNVQVLIGISLFNGTPIYNNFSSGAYSSPRPDNVTFQHAVYYALPFDYSNDVWGYVTLSLFNLHISYICSSWFVAIDLLISLIIFHVWGHVKILIHNLENFPRPRLESGDCEQCCRYSEEEMNDVRDRLRENIAHHNLILHAVAEIENTFGWMLLLYYTFHQICGCFLLLQCSQMDPRALTRYGPLTVILFQQLIQISVVFELLSSLYDRLSSAVYNVPWHFMDTKNRKLVLTFLRQAQKPLNLKAASMVPIGVQTMATILKTSVSYFVMLQTVADE